MLGEGLFGRPKKRFWREIIAFSPQLYRKIMLIRGKCNFLLELPQNMLERNTENYSPCVRSIVKSSSRNSLEILQLHIRKGSVFSQLSTLIRSRQDHNKIAVLVFYHFNIQCLSSYCLEVAFVALSCITSHEKS